MDFLVVLLIGVGTSLVGAVIYALLSHLIGRSKRENVVRSKLEFTTADAPDFFTDLTTTWEAQGQPEPFHDTTRLWTRFEELLLSETSAVFVIGAFGTGKTYLCRYFCNRRGRLRVLSKPPATIYLNASRFESLDINREIIQQLKNKGCPDFDETDFSSLLNTRRAVFFFDGMDQIPAKREETDVLDAILNFVEKTFIRQPCRATAFLVVRSEFYKTSPLCRRWAERGRVPLVQVLGFTEDTQKNAFLTTVDERYGDARWQKLKELCDTNPNLQDLFVRPLLVERFSKISMDNVRLLVPGGVTLSEVFRLSFEDFDQKDKATAMELAFKLYLRNAYVIGEESDAVRTICRENQGPIRELTRLGVLVYQRGTVEFSHATFRDYFAAESIVRAIEEGRGEEALKHRIIHYLVAEFVAGLLDKKGLEALLETMDASEAKWVRYNGMDILSEIVDDRRHQIAEQYIRERIARQDFTATKFDEYKLFLASIAGVYGMAEPMEYVLRHLDRLGPHEFMGKYFHTRDSFLYYDGIDRCFWEWIDHLASRRHAFFRLICIRLMGELSYTPALPVLRKVAQDLEEDASLRDFAAQAVRRIQGVHETAGSDE